MALWESCDAECMTCASISPSVKSLSESSSIVLLWVGSGWDGVGWARGRSAWAKKAQTASAS